VVSRGCILSLGTIRWFDVLHNLHIYLTLALLTFAGLSLIFWYVLGKFVEGYYKFKAKCLASKRQFQALKDQYQQTSVK